MTITIHTDGSCETQTRIGGYAAILQCGEHRREIAGRAEDVTINVMELTAVIEALKVLKTAGQTVQVFTDSNYVAKGVNDWMPDWITRGWKTARNKPVANADLWQALKALLDVHDVTVNWIPREQNSDADKLAQAARMNEPQADELPQPDCHLLIAGSRDATAEMLDYARRVVRRAHEKGYMIVVGDNPKGVDYAVVQECRRLQAKVIVCGIANYPRNGGCKHSEYIKVERDIYRAGKGRLFEAYHARDRYMADMSDIGIFVWDGESRGTKAGFDYMDRRGKDAHLINFDEKSKS
jgi:ribonuclease HI